MKENFLMKKFISVLLPLSVMLHLCMVPAHAIGSVTTETVEIHESVPVYQTAGAFYDSPMTLADTDMAEIEAVIRDAIENLQSGFNLSELEIVYTEEIGGEILALIQDIISETPEYFFASLNADDTGSVHISYDMIYYADNPNVYYLNEFYNVFIYTLQTKEAVAERTAQVEAAADAIIKDMNKSGAKTDFDKALFIHDALAVAIEYDNTFTHRRLDDALIDKTCVCSGYALAYKYLMNRCDIDCVNVYYTPEDTEGHQWSMIKLNGNWYHVDVTSDDPINMTFGHDMAGQVMHTYFMLSDEQLRRISAEEQKDNVYSHSYWYAKEEASASDSTYENAVWHTGYEINYPVAFVGNDRYFVTINNDTKYADIYKCNSDMTSPQLYCTITNRWYLPDGSNRFYTYFGGFGAFCKYIYYAVQDKLMRIDTTLTTPSPETVPGFIASGDLDIYGSYVANGAVYYANGIFDNEILQGTDNDNMMSFDLTCKLTLMDGNKTVGESKAVAGDKIAEPQYFKFNYIVKGWYKDEALTDKWDFENNTLDNNTTLYVKTVDTSLRDSGNLIYNNGRLTGKISAILTNSDSDMDADILLGVYDKNGILKYMTTAKDNEFDLSDASFDHQLTNGQLTYKIFAWNSLLTPYTTPANGTVKQSSGGSSGSAAGGGSSDVD